MEKNKLQREEFDTLAEYFNIPLSVRYEKFEKKFNVMREIINASEINEDKQQEFIEIIKDRLKRLELAE